MQVGNMKDRNVTIKVFSFPYILVQIPTAMIGYTIHSSIFWSIMDFVFWPFAWCKWLVMQEVNLTLIKQTFGFFLK